MAQDTSMPLLRGTPAPGVRKPLHRPALRERHSWLASIVLHACSLAAMMMLIAPRAEPSRPIQVVNTQVSPPDRSPAVISEVVPTLLASDGSGESPPSGSTAGGADGGRLASPVRLPGDAVRPHPAILTVPEGALALAVPAPAEHAQAARARRFGAAGNDLARGFGGLLGGRGRGMKGKLLKEYGGSKESEHAVGRGLDWLARHQNPDGSWSLDGFARLCNGACTGTGLSSDTAATALGVLPFLGAGHTHEKGPFKRVVRKALEWLLAQQREDGNLISGAGSMYSHGLASIALCEAYAMTHDSQLRPAAQRALDFIVRAQHAAGGGWRYFPNQPGDTSVVGWQLMALFSGRMGELEVPSAVPQQAGRFLDSVATDAAGGSYAYMSGWDASPVMTAEALLCRMYLGWPREHPGMVRGVRWLLEEHPPDVRRRRVYYWYYATQLMHHMGGEAWQRWNAMMRDVLVGTQITQGHSAGSWDPPGPAEDFHSAAGGRLMVTSLAMLTLEAYYRHLPLYDRQRVEQRAQRERAQQPPTAAVGP